MYKIRVPASTSNLGPGFDCLGLAFRIYNTFAFETADQYCLENTEPRFRTPDNLFLQAYRSTFAPGEDIPALHVVFETDIPVSRGLGSSAAMTVAGIAAGHIIRNDKPDGAAWLKEAVAFEHHPDNAAPALFGGLTACITDPDGTLRMHALQLAENLRFTLLIPDAEVSTEKARSILPDTYPRGTAVHNASHAVYLTEALRTGDMDLLKTAAVDLLHEPYRKTLIPDFDTVKKTVTEDTDGVFLISGSGSTCLLISERPLSAAASEVIHTLPDHWQIRTAEVCTEGIEIMEDSLWHRII